MRDGGDRRWVLYGQASTLVWLNAQNFYYNPSIFWRAMSPLFANSLHS
jgi:hypothetical protein